MTTSTFQYGTPTKNRPLLSTSLQTAYNLRVLPSLVQSLVLDLSEAVEERIKNAFDMSRIGKDVVSAGAKGMWIQNFDLLVLAFFFGGGWFLEIERESR
jgi:hypothetical protein